jgi:hypothetical protein
MGRFKDFEVVFISAHPRTGLEVAGRDASKGCCPVYRLVGDNFTLIIGGLLSFRTDFRSVHFFSSPFLWPKIYKFTCTEPVF